LIPSVDCIEPLLDVLTGVSPVFPDTVRTDFPIDLSQDLPITLRFPLLLAIIDPPDPGDENYQTQNGPNL
jgi:hypothetical protein